MILNCGCISESPREIQGFHSRAWILPQIILIRISAIIPFKSTRGGFNVQPVVENLSSAAIQPFLVVAGCSGLCKRMVPVATAQPCCWSANGADGPPTSECGRVPPHTCLRKQAAGQSRPAGCRWPTPCAGLILQGLICLKGYLTGSLGSDVCPCSWQFGVFLFERLMIPS